MGFIVILISSCIYFSVSAEFNLTGSGELSLSEVDNFALHEKFALQQWSRTPDYSGSSQQNSIGFLCMGDGLNMNTEIWNTAGSAKMRMQDDGNLVIYRCPTDSNKGTSCSGTSSVVWALGDAIPGQTFRFSTSGIWGYFDSSGNPRSGKTVAVSGCNSVADNCVAVLQNDMQMAIYKGNEKKWYANGALSSGYTPGNSAVDYTNACSVISSVSPTPFFLNNVGEFTGAWLDVGSGSPQMGYWDTGNCRASVSPTNQMNCWKNFGPGPCASGLSGWTFYGKSDWQQGWRWKW
jgi:hypothetical protein